MRVLAFSNCVLDSVLGSGRTRLAWSTGLRARGHSVDIVESDELLNGNDTAPARRLRMGWGGWRWLARHDLRRYDLIEFYGAEFWPGTAWLSRRPPGKRPLLIAHTDGLELLAAERTAHAPAAFSAGTPRPPWWRAAAAGALQRAEKMAFTRADGFVTGCELDRRFLRERRLGPRDRMEVIPLGLEPDYLDRPFQPDGREHRVAFVGSWVERKGIPQLLAAMIPLLRERPDLGLDIFGVSTRMHDPLRDFPPELHPQIVVQPRLSVPDMAARLSQAKVFFFPSEYEGFGLGLAEAMACGCAAVTTPTGYGADLRDGEEAILCPFGAADAMRAAIARLLDDEPTRARLAGAGWRRVQGLRWERSVDKLEATYLRWLEEKAKGKMQKAKVQSGN